MRTDQYSEYTFQLKFRSNADLPNVLVEILKASVNTVHYNPLRQLICDFRLFKLSSPFRKNNNICQLLRTATHFFKVNDTLNYRNIEGSYPPDLVTTVDAILLTNN
jgi:hypothetical protein